jgi:hypothetical protein
MLDVLGNDLVPLALVFERLRQEASFSPPLRDAVEEATGQLQVAWRHLHQLQEVLRDASGA